MLIYSFLASRSKRSGFVLGDGLPAAGIHPRPPGVKPPQRAKASGSLITTAAAKRRPNMHNCTEDYEQELGALLLQYIIYIPVLILGIPLNFIAFWVFCCKLKTWTETRVYMMNLMVADISLLFALPFLIYFNSKNYPRNNLCFTIRNIYFTNMPMSIFIITLIAVDRYIAIKFPLKAKIIRSPLKSASICGLLWLGLIFYYSLRPNNDEKEQYCFHKQSIQPNYSMIYSVIFQFIIPLVIVTFCSVQVIKCLKKKMATSSHETKLIQKAIHIISVNLCVFVVCFSPFYITMLLRFAVDVAGACSLRSEIRASFQICACLANSNCCLDVICYYFAAKEFQEFSSLLPTCVSMRFKMNQSQESQPPTDQTMI